jgi:putative ABC transport system permease protein
MFDRDRWNEIWLTLTKNKWRTFFTAFGVFWGIFMLIVMMGSGNGLYNGVNSGWGGMATNSMFMWTQQTTLPYKGLPRGRFFNFRNDDTRALLLNIPEIEYIAPRLQGWGGDGNNNVVRNERTGAFTIFGDYPELNLIDPLYIEKGRFINENDIADKRKVAVIGSRVVSELFVMGEDPLGQYIRIQGVYFQVVGVFSSKKRDQQAQRENQNIIIPFTTLQKTYNYGDIVGWYAMTAKRSFPVADMEARVKAFLMQRHKIHPEDTRAIGSFNVENEFNKMNRLFAGINGLIWIVGIGTLLAGVVGISNIMLVVIRERTREIGIQRALGATPWTIVSQVLAESAVLTTLAGYFGLVAGVGLIELVNKGLSASGSSDNMFQDPGVSFGIALAALGVLIVSGLVAGIIPARKAVTVKPIDALRYE